MASDWAQSLGGKPNCTWIFFGAPIVFFGEGAKRKDMCVGGRGGCLLLHLNTAPSFSDATPFFAVEFPFTPLSQLPLLFKIHHYPKPDTPTSPLPCRHALALTLQPLYNEWLYVDVVPFNCCHIPLKYFSCRSCAQRHKDCCHAQLCQLHVCSLHSL